MNNLKGFLDFMCIIPLLLLKSGDILLVTDYLTHNCSNNLKFVAPLVKEADDLIFIDWWLVELLLIG